MYKVLEVDGANSYETFFDLQNLETGEKITCFEPGDYSEYKSFHFIKEGEVYDCLIEITGEFIDKKEYEYDDYYEILELNVRIGNWKFAKIKLNETIYYLKMDDLEDAYKGDLKELKIGDEILFRQMTYRLLQVNDVINDDYQITDEYIRRTYNRLERAKRDNEENTIKYCLLKLRMLED